MRDETQAFRAEHVVDRLSASVKRILRRSERGSGSQPDSPQLQADGSSTTRVRIGGTQGVKTFCNAPWTSLYLDQMGDVRACCQNAEYPLGNITNNSLREIWDGKRTKSLREALMRSDLSLGCQFCRWQMAENNESLVYARTFDHLSIPASEPDWPQQLELSLSNACNLQCVMCNGDWSSSIRTHREGRAPLPAVYGEAFFEELALFLPHLRVVKLLGGEPFLGRESLRVLDMLVDMGLTPEVHVTTNGTQWSSRIERIMDSLPMHIIVSLDGCDRETYESIRIGADFDAVMENLERFETYARRHGTRVNLAHCLMTTNWQRFADFLRFADNRDLPVGVNTVTSPVELSLHHLHPDRLDEVIRQLDAIDDQMRSVLGRNRAVWIDQIERLHHRQKALADFADVSYYLGRTILGVPWRRRPDARDHQTEARELVSSLPGRQVGPVLTVNDKEIVTSVDPSSEPNLVGVDISQLVGKHASELFSVFSGLYGEGTPEILSNDQDLQHWRIGFDGPSGLLVDAVMAPIVDHAGVANEVRIHLAAHLPVADFQKENIESGRGPNPEAQESSAFVSLDTAAWFRTSVSPSTVYSMLIDGEGVVLEIQPDPSDVLGLDLSGLVGSSVAEMIEAFIPEYGSLDERTELELPAGAAATARLERVKFAGTSNGPFELRVLMDVNPSVAGVVRPMQVLIAAV